jgi:histidine ammonia-lyase
MLERVRELVRRHVPHLDDDRHFQPDLARAADLVGRGALIDAIGDDILPSLDRSLP